MYLKPLAHLRHITHPAETHAPHSLHQTEQYLKNLSLCVRERVHTGFHINKSLLAMPVNLSSFCISSTYDTCLLQAILRDGNLLPRPPVSCVIKTHVLHLTFLVHVKLL